MNQTWRAPVICHAGVVAAPHYLASAVGARVLEDGGNALDAAIAANATTGVVLPQQNGIGGDLFLLIYWAKTGELLALNASGRSPAGASIDRLRALGHSQMPVRGALAVTAPGAVAGWFAAHERFGTLGLDRLLAPAIRYAEEGFPVSGWLSEDIVDEREALSEAARDVFLPDGRAPRVGDRLIQRDYAESLRRIVRQGSSGFYGGETAHRIAAGIRAAGGLLDEADLEAVRADWVEPIRTSYRGVDIFELPPNTQGVAVLEMLNLLSGFDMQAMGHLSADAIHVMVEAKRLAFADRDQYAGDPTLVAVPTERMVSRDYADERRGLIDRARAAERVGAGPMPAARGDTIYLCTADRDGNAVSLIQSLYHGFGSGVMAPGTGICLQNRGASFNLDAAHPNSLAPRKRPRHTLIPAMALRSGKPLLVFGAAGGDGQPQTQVQLLTSILDFGLDPQAAVEAPRWIHGSMAAADAPTSLSLESRIGRDVAAELGRRGHHAELLGPLERMMGWSQVIQLDHDRGVMVAGSDPRADGAAIGL